MPPAACLSGWTMQPSMTTHRTSWRGGGVINCRMPVPSSAPALQRPATPTTTSCRGNALQGSPEDHRGSRLERRLLHHRPELYQLRGWMRGGKENSSGQQQGLSGSAPQGLSAKAERASEKGKRYQWTRQPAGLLVILAIVSFVCAHPPIPSPHARLLWDGPPSLAEGPCNEPQHRCVLDTDRRERFGEQERKLRRAVGRGHVRRKNPRHLRGGRETLLLQRGCRSSSATGAWSQVLLLRQLLMLGQLLLLGQLLRLLWRQ